MVDFMKFEGNLGINHIFLGVKRANRYLIWKCYLNSWDGNLRSNSLRFCWADSCWRTSFRSSFRFFADSVERTSEVLSELLSHVCKLTSDAEKVLLSFWKVPCNYPLINIFDAGCTWCFHRRATTKRQQVNTTWERNCDSTSWCQYHGSAGTLIMLDNMLFFFSLKFSCPTCCSIV